MQKKPLLYFAFFLLCLLAIGGGNQLRYWLNPDEVRPENTLFSSLGKSIKGVVRSHLGINGTDHTDPKLVQRGQSLYAEYCAPCHGKNLEGQTTNWRLRNEDGTLPAPPHDEKGHTWHHNDQLLFDYTKKGGQAMAPKEFKSGMPGFSEDLSDGDIWAILSFIKSTWPEKIRKRQATLN
jgi:cytochrome c5